MPAPYRAAVIGCGKIGSQFADDPNRERIGIYSHAEAYATCEQTELVAVCDAKAKRARECATRWGLDSAYSDVRALLDTVKPDIVSICTPDATHFEIGLAVLSTPSVKGLLMEKPLALNLAEAERLVTTAERAGIKLAVDYSRRYAASHQRLKKQIADGAIGKIQAIHGYYTKGILHNGTHWIDLLRFLAGEIESARALSPASAEETDPTINVCFTLASGAQAILQGCDHRLFSVFEMDLVGTAGRVRLCDGGHRFETYLVEDSQFYSGYRALDRSAGVEGGMRDVTINAVTDLAVAIRNDSSPCCSALDALASLRFALQVASS